MAIARVGTSTFSSSGAGGSPTAWTLSKPAGVAAGHLLMVCVDAGPYTGSVTPPSDWATAQHVDSTANVDGSVFYKVATASEPSSYSFTVSSYTMSGDAVLVAYSGVDTTNPVQASANAQGSTAAPSLTLSKAGLLVDVWMAAAAGTSFAPPAGMTKDVESNVYRSVTLASQAVSAGTTGTRTASPSANVLFSVGLASSNVAPNAPTLTSPANNQPIDRGIVQRFAWTFSDPDAGDSQSKFDLQYRVVNTTPWTTVSGTTPNTFYDFAASTFAAGNYEWQVRTYDSQGVVGPWCSSSFFTAADAPPQPTITAPTSGATVQNTATLTWSAPNQTDYQWRRVKDNAGSADTSTIYQDSGDVVDSTTRSLPNGLTFDTNNRYEHIQVRIKNAGLWSSWADIRVQVSYTPPTVATFTMAADPTAATRTLTITNPAPGSGVPATSYNDVYVRTAASSTVLDTYRPYSATGTRIGTQLATNTAFVDRTPAGSPVVYEYRVVSVASNGTTSDSGWVSTA